MFAATHRLIAHKVFEAVKEELEMEINYDSLLFGSIAPDINPPLLIKSHCKDGSIEYVHELIDWLKSSKLPENLWELETFSYKLGVVIHFLSDYFCKVHNGRKCNIISHLIYENRLKKYFSKRIKQMSVKASGRKYAAWELIDNIKVFINDKHSEYIGLKRSMTNDINFSLNVSIAVSLNIVAACVINANEELLLQTA